MARLAFGGAEFAHVHADGLTSAGSGGALTYDTVVARSGARSFKFASAAAASPSGVNVTYIYGALSTGTLYVRIAFRFDAAPSAAVQIAAWTNGAANVVRADLNADGTVSFRTGGGTLIGTSAALATGTWHILEMSLQGFGVSGSLPNQGFWAETRLNGSAVGSPTNVSTTPPLPNVQFKFGFVNSVTLSNAINLNFDDWAINDATGATDNTWIGTTEKSVLLLPASDSAIGANWTLGNGTAPSANAYDSVNNVPPTGKSVSIGAGDQIANAVNSTASPAADADVNLQTYTAAGLAAGDVVQVVQAVVEASPATAAAQNVGVAVVSNPAVTETTPATAASATSLFPTGWTRLAGTITTPGSEPAHGTAPVLRVGRRTASANALRICAAGLYVAYESAPPGGPISIGEATETDLAQPLTGAKIKAAGQPSETDTAQPVTAAKTRTIGQAAQTDQAQPLTARKIVVLGQAIESSTAQPVTKAKTRTVAQAVETDVAQGVARVKTRTVGQPSESSVARAVARFKTRLLAHAAETDTALPLVGQPHVVLLGLALDVQTAQPITGAKARALGVATETNLADALVAAKLRVIGLAVEVDVAQHITSPQARRAPYHLVGTSAYHATPTTPAHVTRSSPYRATPGQPLHSDPAAPYHVEI